MSKFWKIALVQNIANKCVRLHHLENYTLNLNSWSILDQLLAIDQVKRMQIHICMMYTDICLKCQKYIKMRYGDLSRCIQIYLTFSYIQTCQKYQKFFKNKILEYLSKMGIFDVSWPIQTVVNFSKMRFWGISGPAQKLMYISLSKV